MTWYTLNRNRFFSQRLGNASTHSEIAGHWSIDMQKDYVAVAKDNASVLIETLKGMGIPLKRTQALEVVSQLQARTDWNRLQAKLKEFRRDPVVTPQSATAFDACFVVARPGEGKTETLKTLYEIECIDNKRLPILVCMAGGVHTYRMERDLSRKIARSSRLTIQYDRDGILSSEIFDKSAYIPEPETGLLINFVSSVRGERVGAGLALAQFLDQIKSYLPSHLVETKLGSLLIDEFHQIAENECNELFQAINKYVGTHSQSFNRLVVATQVGVSQSLVENLALKKTVFVSSEIKSHFVLRDTVMEHVRLQRESDKSVWKSESFEDNLAVGDVFAMSLDIASRGIKDFRENGDSRHWRLTGVTPRWLNDLRLSLIA